MTCKPTTLQVLCPSEGDRSVVYLPFWLKFLSDTFRKIPWKFQLNLFSLLGGVVVIRFCDRRTDWLTDGRTGGNYRLALLENNRRIKNLHPLSNKDAIFLEACPVPVTVRKTSKNIYWNLKLNLSIGLARIVKINNTTNLLGPPETLATK